MDGINGNNPGAPGGGKTSFKDAWAEIQATMGEKPKPQRQVKKTLDKDDFLKIMITQMQHQDPTQPFESDKLAAEIAQVATVEQLSNVNKALEKLGTRNQPLERLAMTNLIGKQVTVNRNIFEHKKGQPEALSFSLGSDAKNVRVQIVSDQGETVYDENLGSKKAGLNSFKWDGQLPGGVAVPSGGYMLRVQAEAEGGRPVQTNTAYKARVMGVSFNGGGDPVFLVGDANHQERIKMNNISQIEEGAPMAAPAMGAPAATAPGGRQAVNQAKSQAVFTFEKGKGSRKLGANEITPELQNSINKMHSERDARKAVAAAAAKAQETSGETGFPNGLGMYNKSGASAGAGNADAMAGAKVEKKMEGGKGE